MDKKIKIVDAYRPNCKYEYEYCHNLDIKERVKIMNERINKGWIYIETLTQLTNRSGATPFEAMIFKNF